MNVLNFYPKEPQFDISGLKTGTTEDLKLPEWKCHKIVKAARIEKIEVPPSVHDPAAQCGPLLVLHDEQVGYWVLDMGEKWMQKFEPQAGGYFVVYEDGYASFSPAKAFEEGYTRCQ